MKIQIIYRNAQEDNELALLQNFEWIINLTLYQLLSKSFNQSKDSFDNHGKS